MKCKLNEQKKNVLILGPYKFHEVLNATSGGPALVKEEIKYFREECHSNVDFYSLFDVSIGFYIIQLLTTKRIQGNNSKNQQPKVPLGILLGPFLIGITEVLLRLADRKYWKFLKKIGGKKYDIVIYNRPIGVRYFKRKTQLMTMVVEHNVEYEFFAYNKFKEKGIENSTIPKIITKLIKFIEKKNLEQADYILALNDTDAKKIAKLVKNESKVIIWIPIRRIHRKPLVLHRNTKKAIIGFVGSNARHNIDAVNRIIQLAKKLPQSKFEFWIIGSVGKAFEKYTEEIPSNVRFLGFVDNLHRTLEGCDIFINPKFISPTGIEVKMFDYLKANKPIISTRLGAKGFEELIGKKIFIADSIEEMAEILLSIIEEGG